MSALPPPPPPPLPLLLLLLALLAAPAVLASRAQSASASQPEADHQSPPSPGNATQLGSGVAGGGGSNSSVDAVVTRISSLLRDLPTLKATVIVACAFSALLIACLLLRVFRWVASPSSLPGWLHGRRRHGAVAAAATAHCPTCAHRCSSRRAPARRAPLCSICQGGIRRAGEYIWFFQAHISGTVSPFKAVWCVPSPRFYCFPLLTVTSNSEFRPPFRGICFYVHFTKRGNIQRELAYTGTQRWRDNLV